MISNIGKNIAATQSGSWTVTSNAGTGFPDLAVTGSTTPTEGILAMGHDGTNARPILVDTGGVVQVDIVSGGGGGGEVSGTTSHDAAWSTLKPVGLGGYASTAAPSAVSADGDIVNLWADRSGRLSVWDGGLTLSIDDGSGSITVDGTVAVSGNVTVVGAAAHDAAVSGNPVRISGYASATAPTGVADGDTVNLWADANGRLAVWDGASTISIDDGGGAITVDGTVTSNAGTGFPAVATFGSAHPATGIQNGYSDGTNTVRARGTSTGAAWVTGEPISALTNQKTVSVSTTRTPILASNSSRKGFLLVNHGNQDIYLGNGSVLDGTTAQANGGILISSNGGSLSGSQIYGYTGALEAVAAASTTVVGVLEW